MGGSTRLGSKALPEWAEADCIACGSPLSFLPDSYPLAFHCENGHSLTLKDLLDDLLSESKIWSETTVECWDRKARLLHHFALRALMKGHAFTAADFQEAADRIDQWVIKLRKLLSRR